MTRAVFDRLFAEGESALRLGTHRRDAPPSEGGRWPVSIMARPPAPTRERCAAWTRVASTLRSELAETGGYEDGFDRNMWYASLLHFAADIADPDGLVEWVRARRDIEPQLVVFDAIELVRFHYQEDPSRLDGQAMMPTTWQRVRLEGTMMRSDPERAVHDGV